MITKRTILFNMLLGLILINTQTHTAYKAVNPKLNPKQEQLAFDKENWWQWFGATTLTVILGCYYLSSNKYITDNLNKITLKSKKILGLKNQNQSALKPKNQIPKLKITFSFGDITKKHGDQQKKGVIVSNVNRHTGLTSAYMQSGGASGAIGKAAGKKLIKDKKIVEKHIEPGKAIITPAYGLTKNGYSHIIHTTSPHWQEKNTTEYKTSCELLKTTYTNAFKAASRVGAEKVVLAPLSKGVSKKYPDINEAARIGLRCAEKALLKSATIKEIVFVFFTEAEGYMDFALITHNQIKGDHGFGPPSKISYPSDWVTSYPLKMPGL